MQGKDLKDWVRQASYKPEQLCVILDISLGTLHNWYRSNALDNRTILALAQLGCPKAQQVLIQHDAASRLLRVGSGR